MVQLLRDFKRKDAFQLEKKERKVLRFLLATVFCSDQTDFGLTLPFLLLTLLYDKDSTLFQT